MLILAQADRLFYLWAYPEAKIRKWSANYVGNSVD